MLKRILSVVLTVVIGQTFVVSALAHDSVLTAHETAQVKAEVVKRGTGEKAKVTVILRDRSSFQGYIEGAGPDSFTVIGKKSREPETFAYSEVLKVKGTGLSGKKKILFATLAAGVVAAALAANNSSTDWLK